jgi:hypothetical protein
VIGAYATVAVVCVAAVVAGQAILSLGGRRDFSWTAAPVGLAALLVVAGIAIQLPGHATAAAIAIAALTGLSLVWLWLSGGALGFIRSVGVAAPAALLALLGASLPFIAAGRVGILGVGLVNDDMAYHLLIADWLGSHEGPAPKLVRDGYPVGPHALVDGVGSILGSGLVETFAGLTLAIAVLLALVAAGALRDLRPGARAVCAALVALCYLGAAYLAQEAFKEPIESLFVIGFALLLPSVTTIRSAIPLGVIAAGTVYAYSFPGLAWLAGTAVAYAVLVALVRAGWGRRRPTLRTSPTFAANSAVNVGFGRRRVRVAVLAAGIVLVALVAPEIPRLVDFTHFRAFRTSNISGGLGNLRHQLSPLEALGVWPTSEFRLAASDSSHPIAFYLGSLLAAAAFAVGLWRWLRSPGSVREMRAQPDFLVQRGVEVPAALAAAVVIYLGALAFGTVYTSAKALAIAAPLVLLVSFGGLLGLGRRVRSPAGALAALLAIAAAFSSFLVLRQAPIGPTDHHDELAVFRPLVAGKRVLFLGRDDFVQYDLLGSRPYVAVRNFYDDYYVKPDLRLGPGVFMKFDFDSVTARKLHRFQYVITTRGAFASGPPASLRLMRTTPSFALWRRVGPLTARETLSEGKYPGAVLRCASPSGQRISRAGGTATVFARSPVHSARWTPEPTVEDGERARATLHLPAGRWEISIQYDASRPLTLTAPRFRATIPGNLDYRGSTPYYPVGRLDGGRAGAVKFTASVERPPLAGRLLGAHSVAHLGAIAASPAGTAARALPGDGEQRLALGQACGRYVDWYAPGP